MAYKPTMRLPVKDDPSPYGEPYTVAQGWSGIYAFSKRLPKRSREDKARHHAASALHSGCALTYDAARAVKRADAALVNVHSGEALRHKARQAMAERASKGDADLAKLAKSRAEYVSSRDASKAADAFLARHKPRKQRQSKAVAFTVDVDAEARRIAGIRPGFAG